MAKTLVAIETCDLCKREGLPEAEADRSVNLAIDGPPKRFELCPQHVQQLKPYIELYQDEDYGVDESLKPKKRSQQKQELEPSPWFNVPEAEQPRQLEMATSEPAKPVKKKAKEDKSEDHIVVTCSLPHPNGKEATVQYRSRNSHAKEMHDGLKVWDVEWGDPAGALTHLCEAHDQCMKVKLAFPSETSLSRHIRMCPLEKLPEVA